MVIKTTNWVMQLLATKGPGAVPELLVGPWGFRRKHLCMNTAVARTSSSPITLKFPRDRANMYQIMGGGT